MMKFDRKTFFDAMRKAFGPRLRQMQVDGAEVLLSAMEADDQLINIRQAAYLLATAWHETATTLRPICEFGNKAYFNKYDPLLSKSRGHRTRARRMGNTEKGDGFKYRGRGFVQMTWKANYQRASEELGVDFVANPDLALDPVHAYRLLSTGLREGWFTGKKLGDYINDHHCDYPGARRTVNGNDRAQAIARHAKTFERCLAAAKVSAEPVASQPASHSPPAGDVPGDPVVAKVGAAKTTRYRPPSGRKRKAKEEDLA